MDRRATARRKRIISLLAHETIDSPIRSPPSSHFPFQKFTISLYFSFSFLFWIIREIN